MKRYVTQISYRIVHSAEDGEQAFGQVKAFTERQTDAVQDGVVVDAVSHQAVTEPLEPLFLSGSCGMVGSQQVLWEQTALQSD